LYSIFDYGLDEDAHEELLNLSPSELKNLLHHILSGKEFRVDQDSEYLNHLEINLNFFYKAVDHSNISIDITQSQLSVVVPTKKDIHGELRKEVQVCSDLAVADLFYTLFFFICDRRWTWGAQMKSQIVKDSGADVGD